MLYTDTSANLTAQVTNSISLIEFVGFNPVRNLVSRQSAFLTSRKSYGQLLNACTLAV